MNDLVKRKKTWDFIKNKVLIGAKLDYVEKRNRYQVFIIEGNTKYFINLFAPNHRRVKGQSPTNAADYQDFLTNYKMFIDVTPPTHPGPVNLDGVNKSELGKKLEVHSTFKPDKVDPDSTIYATWIAAGDRVDGSPSDGEIAEGDVLEFDNKTGTPSVTKNIKFHPDNGKVWLHEGYLRFEGGSIGDYIDATIVAEATPLQTSVNLDLVLNGDFVEYAPGGPGTGTHGFADATKIQLLPRTLAKDGAWNFDGVNLTPSLGSPKTGLYNISHVEKTVHQFFAKIPCAGSCPTYFSMSSNDTTELLPNYMLRVTTHNNSNTDWIASVIVEAYRERTFRP